MIRERLKGHERSLRLLAVGLSVVGYLLCAEALLGHGIMLAGGQGGGDVFAYWTAGNRLDQGQSIYGAAVGGYAAYLYPPILAQAFMPLSHLPFPLVVWLWRAVELGCLRLAVGSWLKVGLALLLWPPAISELDAGNVHLLIAGAVGLAIAGRPQALIPVALTKFASLAAVPMVLRRNPRALVPGIAAAAVIGLVSFAAAPQLWWDYASFATQIGTMDSGWYNLGAAVPLWLRLAAAGGAAVWSLRQPRAAALAATLALPVLWFHGLSVLVAVARDPRPALDLGSAEANGV